MDTGAMVIQWLYNNNQLVEHALIWVLNLFKTLGKFGWGFLKEHSGIDLYNWYRLDLYNWYTQ